MLDIVQEKNKTMNGLNALAYCIWIKIENYKIKL